MQSQKSQTCCVVLPAAGFSLSFSLSPALVMQGRFGRLSQRAWDIGVGTQSDVGFTAGSPPTNTMHLTYHGCKSMDLDCHLGARTSLEA